MLKKRLYQKTLSRTFQSTLLISFGRSYNKNSISNAFLYLLFDKVTKK